MSGASARARSSSSAVRAPRKSSGRQKTITPTLTCSPRSMSGTRRSTAYENGSATRPVSLGDEPARLLEPPQEVVDVHLATFPFEPLVGHLGRREPERLLAHAGSQPDVCRLDRGCVGEKDVVADRLERAARVLRRGLGSMVEVEGSAVVDQPQAPVPPEQVRVLRRAVDVGDQRVEPDGVCGEARLWRGPGGRTEGQRAGEEIDAEVEPTAREQ